MQRLDAESVPLSGTTVIEASAGTGKTYTITSLFLRLVLERRLKVSEILVVTYTRAATAELRQRIRARLEEALRFVQGAPIDDALVVALCTRFRAREGELKLRETVERAIAHVDEAPVFTIHAFCQRTLAEHAFESGARMGLEVTTHAAPVLAEIADDYFTGQLYQRPLLSARGLLAEPEPLRNLAARSAAADDLRVLPARVEAQEFDASAWQAAYRACRDLWETQREEVCGLITRCHKSSQYVAAWAAQWSDALRLGRPGCTRLCSEAARASFTRSGLRERLRKGVPLPEHPYFELAEQFVAAEDAYLALEEGEQLRFRRAFVDYLHDELRRRARSGELYTFDGLVSELDRALAGELAEGLIHALRKRYRAALVDEFQDTDPVQYRIFRRVFGGETAPLFLIGDPKQAIYGFRGADVHAYLTARTDAGERVYTLDVNRRSDPGLLHALNRFYAACERPFALDAIAYQPVQAPDGAKSGLTPRDGRAPFHLLFVDETSGGAAALEDAITRAVATDIAQLLESGAELALAKPRPRALRASDIAVLCRKNKQALAMQQALSQLGVPSVFQGDASVFESDDAFELERALEALAHPGDATATRTFLSSRYAGANAESLLALESDDARWDGHRATLQSLHETWLRHGFMQAMRGLVLAYDVETRLLAQADGPRRVTNLWHLVELLAQASVRERLGPLALLRWYRIVRQDETRRAELVGEDHELRLESSEDAVKLTTIHKSKGLEYPIVYCPHLCESVELRRSEAEFVRFHDPQADHALTLDLGSADREAHKKLAEEEALAEALRLLYVALTRAKHRICVVVPDSKQLARSALGYSLFGGGSLESVQAKLKERSAADARQQIEAFLAKLSPCGSSSLFRAPANAPRYQPSGGTARLGGPRAVRRALDQATRVSSFSALTRARPPAHAELGVDHDAIEPSLEASANAPLSALVLDSFPRGAAAGQLVHEVLEHADFGAQEEELRRTVDAILPPRGYGPELCAQLTQGLREALLTPLDDAGLCLASVVRERRLDEMEFVFPVEAGLTPRGLERVFREQRAPAVHPGYARELRELGFDELKGLLRGFVDLVFVHEGRYFVVDYKSNRLGPSPADYAEASLVRAMAEHHYFLQYHLYTLALHRYLALRLRSYDYETHFGGVYYLFLRGMSPRHPARTGVFHDRPARALIEALDALMRPEHERSAP